jgi:IS30 family transposase
MTSFEKAMYAWEKSRQRASKSRRRERLRTQRIRQVVVFILRKWHWSPENISAFLKRFGVGISAKAIYNFIKREKRWLSEYLRQRGKARRQRVARPRSYFKTGVPEKKSIHERPPIIEAGHWECDTIHSKQGSNAAVLSLRELKSKQCFYFILENLTAKSVMKQLFPFFQGLPAQMRQTLTSDNGSEFSELYKLEKALPGLSVYYCDAYKAYQRGSVENANAELRWFFPKKTDFAQVSKCALLSAQYKINGKPRPVHNSRSATVVYREALQAA